MTRERAIEKLGELRGIDDPERSHSRADSILCDFLNNLGYGDVVKAYEDIKPKWYA